MNKHIIAIAILTAFAAAPAWAGNPGNNGDGNGGCGVGQQTNGCGGGTPSGGQGGAGGNGGAGGQGGAGGAVIGSGNSANHNDNRNTNLQGQAQGQLQGQQQGQGQAQGQIANGGSASSSSGASSTSSSGGNILTGGTQSATQANAVTVNGDTVTYQAQQRDPVASAWAAPLTSANGTCMGSTSAGAQGVTIGVSFGTTWTDSGCDARYDAIALQQIGERAAARARLCLKPEIAEAFKRSGHPCEGEPAKAASVPTEAARPVASNNYVN